MEMLCAAHGFPPSARRRDRRLGLAEIGRSLLPRRCPRDCPRKIRSCITGYGSKAPGEPASHRRNGIVIGSIGGTAMPGPEASGSLAGPRKT